MKRRKQAFLQYYETQMRKGQDRGKTLDKLARKIGVTSDRQVGRILAQAAKYEQEIADYRFLVMLDNSGKGINLASPYQSYNLCFFQ